MNKAKAFSEGGNDYFFGYNNVMCFPLCPNLCSYGVLFALPVIGLLIRPLAKILGSTSWGSIKPF
ncbi:MAG: hypothetical protein APZ16_06995 [Candidatus Hadarchaeum yellowstonense]|uniref:Uncharacterized protein n=1 Tax=Hadarchaeum yellowstonense TaxID=1776334 RepID=A0A147K0N3_HADYE|nr:MAG: hypothetical protein APZ16_06995 [Candidatus Hadarchaeum yellowstonense]